MTELKKNLVSFVLFQLCVLLLSTVNEIHEVEDFRGRKVRQDQAVSPNFKQQFSQVWTKSRNNGKMTADGFVLHRRDNKITKWALKEIGDKNLIYGQLLAYCFLQVFHQVSFTDRWAHLHLFILVSVI